MEQYTVSNDRTLARAPAAPSRSGAVTPPGSGREPREQVPWALRFLHLEPRQQVQIASLLRMTGPFTQSHWTVGGPHIADALVIGIGSEAGRAAWQQHRRGRQPLPALLVGSAEQARAVWAGEPATTLLLAPPFRHLSLFYCLDVLARQCAAQRSAVSVAPPPRLRTLVVDDSPTVRSQLSNVVGRIGMHCDCVASAEAALAQLDQAAYDLIVVDVVMPGMDGYRLTREIRRRPGHKATPVIILTSQSSPFDRARGALAGCDLYLAKPVGQREFFEAASKALRRSMPADDLAGRLIEPAPRGPAADTPARAPLGAPFGAQVTLQHR